MGIARLDTAFMISKLRRELSGFEMTPVEFYHYLHTCFDYFANGMFMNPARISALCYELQFTNLGTLIKPDYEELIATTTWFLWYIRHLLLIYEQAAPGFVTDGEFNGRLHSIFNDCCYIELF